MYEAYEPDSVVDVSFHTPLPYIEWISSPFPPCFAHLSAIISIATIEAKQKRTKTKDKIC